MSAYTPFVINFIPSRSKYFNVHDLNVFRYYYSLAKLYTYVSKFLNNFEYYSIHGMVNLNFLFNFLKISLSATTYRSLSSLIWFGFLSKYVLVNANKLFYIDVCVFKFLNYSLITSNSFNKVYDSLILVKKNVSNIVPAHLYSYLNFKKLVQLQTNQNPLLNINNFNSNSLICGYKRSSFFLKISLNILC